MVASLEAQQCNVAIAPKADNLVLGNGITRVGRQGQLMGVEVGGGGGQ